MSALAVFVFQCVDSNLYALTLYRSGENLPADVCAGSWVYRTKLLLTKQSLESLPVDSDAAMAELTKHGLFLARLSSGIISFSD
jgi:hypothetical protein